MTGDTRGASDIAMSLVQGDEIFFREEDVHLISSLAEAIAGDLTSLELIGASKPAIDHYGRILLTRLRQIPNIQLEAYLPTGVESLVDQFNAALSSISMAEATSGSNREKAIKVFISNEISAGNSRDGRMLARLVSSFPGANIKLVWVHQEDSGESRNSALEFAGKYTARWFISPPTRLEAERMLADGSSSGQDERVQQLLRKVAPDAMLSQSGEARPRRLTARQEPVLRENLEIPAAAAALSLPRHAVAGESEAVDDSARKINAHRKMSWLAMFNGVFLVTCLSAIVIALIFPGHIQALAEMLGISPPPIKPLQGAKETAKNAATAAPLLLPLASPAGAKQADESAVATNGVGRPEIPPAASGPAVIDTAPGKAQVGVKEPPAEAKTAPSAQPAVAASPGAPAANTPAAPPAVAAPKPLAAGAAAKAVTAEAPVKTPLLPNSSPPAAAASSAIVAAPAAETKKGLKVATEEKAPALKKNLSPPNQNGSDPLGRAAAQINAAKKGNFFVQFVALDSYAAATAWRDKYDKLSRAQIAQISVEQGAKSKFVVVSGPFKSRDAAEAFAAQKGMPGGAWIRAARPLQAALQKPEKAAQGKKTQGQKSE